MSERKPVSVRTDVELWERFKAYCKLELKVKVEAGLEQALRQFMSDVRMVESAGAELERSGSSMEEQQPSGKPVGGASGMGLPVSDAGSIPAPASTSDDLGELEPGPAAPYVPPLMPGVRRLDEEPVRSMPKGGASRKSGSRVVDEEDAAELEEGKYTFTHRDMQRGATDSGYVFPLYKVVDFRGERLEDAEGTEIKDSVVLKKIGNLIRQGAGEWKKV